MGISNQSIPSTLKGLANTEVMVRQLSEVMKVRTCENSRK